jgi:hypothetical protein
MQGAQNDGEGQQATTTKTTLTGGGIDIYDKPGLGEVCKALMRWAREATNAKESLSIRIHLTSLSETFFKNHIL